MFQKQRNCHDCDVITLEYGYLLIRYYEGKVFLHGNMCDMNKILNAKTKCC